MHRRTVLLLILYKEDCKRFRIGPVTPFFSSSVYSELGFCLFLMLWLTEKQISIWKLWFSKKSLEICTSLEIYVAFLCCIYIKRLFKNKHTHSKKEKISKVFLFIPSHPVPYSTLQRYSLSTILFKIIQKFAMHTRYVTKEIRL